MSILAIACENRPSNIKKSDGATNNCVSFSNTDSAMGTGSEIPLNPIRDATTTYENRRLTPGRIATASAGDATKCNDGEYGVDYFGIGTGKDNTWTARSPAWCALKLDNTKATEILIALSDETGTVDVEGKPGFKNYVLSTSTNSTNGADGVWHEQTVVTGNTFGYREHRIPFNGQRWVKVTVRAPSTAVLDEIDVWDVSEEPQAMAASLIWVGDSITARCADRHGTFGAHRSLQKVIQSNYTAVYPLQIGAGTVSINSTGILTGTPSRIDTYLAMYPDVHFWCVLLGINESPENGHSKTFQTNLVRIVDKIEAAGHEAIIAPIPHSPSKSRSLAARRLNTVIDKVTKQKNLAKGPDLYNLFKQNADSFYSDEDHIHPNRVGCTAWQKAWADVIGPLMVHELRMRRSAGQVRP
ncbi:MAG: SGNH/GDSL hydrolase family protein [Deltaproteobacteria bacterium]|nr:SGNH/GDSL hydrolase family protein [Deltaproteobacteria bacterium]